MRLLDLPAELVDFLEYDDRPSAILNIEQPVARGGVVVYQNGAFQEQRLGQAALDSLVLDLANLQQPERGSAQARVGDRLWRCNKIGNRWRSIVCIDGPRTTRKDGGPEPALRDGANMEAETGHGDDLHIDLTKRLHLTPLQAERKERSFARMASSAPIGMYMFDSDGVPLVCVLLPVTNVNATLLTKTST